MHSLTIQSDDEHDVECLRRVVEQSYSTAICANPPCLYFNAIPSSSGHAYILLVVGDRDRVGMVGGRTADETQRGRFNCPVLHLSLECSGVFEGDGERATT